MNKNEDLNTAPPILGSWKNFYIFVLVIQAIVIFLFYLLMQTYHIPA